LIRVFYSKDESTAFAGNIECSLTIWKADINSNQSKLSNWEIERWLFTLLDWIACYQSM